MYCVKCGVKLKDGVEKCPLCSTAVWNPEGMSNQFSYPEKMPISAGNHNLGRAIILSLISYMAITILLVLCLRVYGKLNWGGYPIFGIVLFDVIFVLPLWFKKPQPIVFSSIDFVAIALYLFYINQKVHGHWFFSFALPIVVVCAILFITIIALLPLVKKGGFFIFGGAIIFIGLASMLVEFFESITFQTRMFVWSIYVVICCLGFGLFLILAGINKPLQHYLKQHFFI